MERKMNNGPQKKDTHGVREKINPKWAKRKGKNKNRLRDKQKRKIKGKGKKNKSFFKGKYMVKDKSREKTNENRWRETEKIK